MAGFENTIVFSNGERLSPSSADDITRMQKTVSDLSRINYTGDPEGNVSANPSSLCHNPSTGKFYFKESGTGNTGWIEIGNSPLIQKPVLLDFTQTGTTPLFTTGNKSFLINQFIILCESATLPNGDATFNIGWTPIDYSDWDSSLPMSITTPQQYFIVSVSTKILVPASTTFTVNITTQDSGIALTGYLIFSGFNI